MKRQQTLEPDPNLLEAVLVWNRYVSATDHRSSCNCDALTSGNSSPYYKLINAVVLFLY